MKIIFPSGETGFVEYKRAFLVTGEFESGNLPDDAILTVTLENEKGETLRRVSCNKKYGAIFAYHPDLTAYPEERDPGRVKMKEYGFPELAGESLPNAETKAWYSDKCFKALVVSATDTAHGALADDGMGYTAADGTPYSLLPMGEYTVTVTLSHGTATLESAAKKVKIGRRENQLICRFNPEDHKEKMIGWCRDMGFSVISDPLPGYLDSYLGDWEYHKGLLKMYRANDLPLFETAKVRMFVYLTAPHSTSYETELAYLQKSGAVGDPERFFAYHYDIGEAAVGKGRAYERTGTPVLFGENEYMSLCRIDVVNENVRDGVYDMSERDVVRSVFNTECAEIHMGERFAVMGVMKPWQCDPSDFVLRDDNTYDIHNYPYIMQYTITDGENTSTVEKKPYLERINGKSIGSSVYEFYNVFDTEKLKIGVKYGFSVCCIDKNGNKTPAFARFFVKVV